MALKIRAKTDILKKIQLNLVFLGIIQLINYVFPLIIARRVLHLTTPSFFGLYSTNTSLVGYFTTIIGFGFFLTGTSTASILHQNKDYKSLSNIFNNVLLIKIILLIISIIVYTYIYKYVIHENYNFLIPGILSITSSFFLCDWLLHGVQNLKYLLLATVIAKLPPLIIFLLVSGEFMSKYYVWIDSLSNLTFGLCTFLPFWKLSMISYNTYGFNFSKSFFLSNLTSFLSSISTYTYTTGNIFFLSLYSTKSTVAKFSISEKFIFVLIGGMSLINRAAFPIISKTFAKFEKKQFLLEIKTLGIVLFFSGLILIFGVNYFSFEISFFLVKTHELTKTIKYLSIVLLYIQIGALASLSLIIIGHAKFVLATNLIVSFINIISCYYLTNTYGLNGFIINYCTICLLSGIIQLFYLNQKIK